VCMRRCVCVRVRARVSRLVLDSQQYPFTCMYVYVYVCGGLYMCVRQTKVVGQIYILHTHGSCAETCGSFAEI